MISNLKITCKKCIEEYQDLNMYKLNLILYFMDVLHRFKLNEPFFDKEFEIDEEMGPYIEDVKEAYQMYQLFNIPKFGANNIFDDNEILVLNENDEVASETDEKTHEVIVDPETGDDAELVYKNKVEQDIYDFIKASMEPMEFTGLLYFYENSKDPEKHVELFLSNKLAAYLKWKQDGMPEPDKSKPIQSEEREDNEITVDDVMARINRKKQSFNNL